MCAFGAFSWIYERNAFTIVLFYELYNCLQRYKIGKNLQLIVENSLSMQFWNKYFNHPNTIEVKIFEIKVNLITGSRNTRN